MATITSAAGMAKWFVGSVFLVRMVLKVLASWSSEVVAQNLCLSGLGERKSFLACTPNVLSMSHEFVMQFNCKEKGECS